MATALKLWLLINVPYLSIRSLRHVTRIAPASLVAIKKTSGQVEPSV